MYKPFSLYQIIHAPVISRIFINAGITEDYSMGYPEEPGFRAGIARPYYFYNISEDQQTSLKIIPFQVMDATLYNIKILIRESFKRGHSKSDK